MLARTTPYAELDDKTHGLPAFVVDLAEQASAINIQPLRLMINQHANALFFDDLMVPRDNLIGEEGEGFRYIIDSWNAERILVAAEALGDGRWFIDRGRSLCERSGRLREADWGESGRTVPDRSSPC